MAGAKGFGRPGYLGPDPPPGDDPHHYVFRLLAVDEPVRLTRLSSYQDVEAAVTGHVLGEARSSGRISGNATAGPSQPRRMPSPTGCTAERRAHYPAAGIGHRTPSGRMPCMGAFTGIHGRKRPHAIRRVGAWLPKAAFAMSAARRAHR
jgi:hypothetical protein